jgi:uncharacterized protein (TIGR01777 family)
VNLLGENIFARRWSKKFKKAIRDSRVESTRALVRAIHDIEERPSVLVSASAVGYYGPREPHETIDERTVDASMFTPKDFLSEVCRRWEHEAREAERHGVRVVRLRIGVVLGPDDGALVQIARPFKMFVGGPIGRGKQAMSWIHLDDLARLVTFCLEHAEIRGTVNAVAPNPVTNKEFSKTLARVLHRPCLFPVPPLMLRIVLGGVASVVTTGQRVVPHKAVGQGFTYRYPDVESALRSVYDEAA